MTCADQVPPPEFRVMVLALPGWQQVQSALHAGWAHGLVSRPWALDVMEEWGRARGQRVTRLEVERMFDEGIPDLAAAWAGLAQVIAEMPEWPGEEEAPRP